MIGQRLKEIRKKRKYTLRKLANLTGLSHGYIADIERGRCNPSLKSLTKLAKSLGVKPEYFLAEMVGEDDQQRSKGA